MERDDRMQWKGRFEFLFTAFGYTIGLGNIWRFPHKCFVNGGGAFLIPYLLSVLLCTIPMLFLEMSLGQFVSEGPVTVWKMNPLFTGVGWAILFNAVMTNVYYIIIVMYTFYYMLVSFVNIGSQLPWERCTEEQDWSTINCRINPNPDLEGKTEADKILEMEKIMDDSCVSRVFSSIEPHLEGSIKSKNDMDFQPFMSNFSTCLIEYRSPAKEYWIRFVLGAHKSKGMDDLGHIELRNLLILFTIWLLVYYCCIRGIRSIAKVIYITATFPFGLMVILLTRGLTLPGYESGIKFYTQPDWTKLTDLNIWASAATQAIFSTGIAYGSHIAMASYNRFNNNILRDAFLIGFINTITSILGGFIIFAFLGHASYKLGKPIEDIFEEGPGILFISYVQGMTLLPGSAIWSFLFFLMAFTLGLDSQFVMVWTVFAALQDKFPLFFKRFKAFALIGICVLQFLLGLPLVTQGGIHMVVLIDRYTADFTVTLFIVLESVSVCWVYGINNFIEDVEMMIGKKSRIFWIYWKVTWVVTTPLFCVFIFLASAVGYTKPSYDGKEIPGSGEAIGLLLIITPTLIFLGVTILQIYRYKGVKPAMKPSVDWQPRYMVNRICRYGQSQPIDDNYITPSEINEACEDPPPPVCNQPVEKTTQL